MPVDGSGNFTRSYSWIADKNGGIKIIASRMDGEFDNYASALNQVFWRSGLVSMTGNLPMGSNTILGLGSGSSGTPAIRFAADTSSGLYSPDVGEVALVAGGNKRLEANASGVEVTGAFSVIGTASIATITASNFTVSGTSNLFNVNVSGNLDVDGLSTLASASLSGTLSVAGTLTAAAINASSNVSVGGTLTVVGTTRLANSGFVFSSDGSLDTGMRWLSDGVFAARCDGVDRVTFNVGGAEVNGSLTVLNTSNLRGTVFLGTTGHGNLGSDTTTTYIRGDNLALQNGAASGTYAYVDSSGNVGIGTTAPTSKLVVASGAGDGSFFGGTGTLTFVGLGGYANPGDGAGRVLYDRASGALSLSNGLRDTQTTRMHITGIGDVGIGTTAPGHKFHVIGNIGASNYFIGTQATADAGTFGFTNGNGPGVVTWGTGTAGAGKIDINVGGATRLAINVFGGIISSDLADAVGYKGLPQDAEGGSFTFDLTQLGKHVLLTGGAANATVPTNATVAFQVGSAITIVNAGSAAKTIVQAAGVTLKLAGLGTTGNRTLAIDGVATLLKTATDTWYISGAGVS